MTELVAFTFGVAMGTGLGVLLLATDFYAALAGVIALVILTLVIMAKTTVAVRRG